MHAQEKWWESKSLLQYTQSEWARSVFNINENPKNGLEIDI